MDTVTVTRHSRTLVQPFRPRPSHRLDLSFIDSLPVLRCNARTLHVFRSSGGHDVAPVIRAALSRALVPYYPLAGRLTRSSQSADGLLQVDCSAQGVWFVEASVDNSITLDQVDCFDHHDVASIPYDHLLPDGAQQGAELEPLVQMQVTQFACGGFVIGLIFCHTICDGLGAAQFLNAVGEIARGLDSDHLSVSPVWRRDFFPQQQRLNSSASASPPPPIIPSHKLEQTNIDISIDQINQAKKQFHSSTANIEKACSTFEIVAASLWKHRTAAIDLDPNSEVQLVFFANCRQLLEPPLPTGFYGNCFFPVKLTASSNYLKTAAVSDVIKLIQEAKGKLRAEFDKYVKGEKGKNEEDPFMSPLAYTTLFISEWGRLGFNDVDYGWGLPVNVVPIQGSGVIPVGIVGWLPSPRRGVRLMTWCVEESHRPALIRGMAQEFLL
ncbi:Acyl transferase 4 [Linum grandiflorum]